VKGGCVVRSGTEYPADCQCKKTAFHRELAVSHPCADGCAVSARRIAYDSHAECLTDGEHHDRLKELDMFAKELHELVHLVNEKLPMLEMGLIRGIDFSIEVAQACEPIKFVRPLVDVSAFHQRTELMLAAVDIETTSVDAIHSAAVEAARGIVAQFKARADAGQVV
jgi:hypothetical protein